MSVKDTLSKIIVITDLHPNAYGTRSLERIVNSIRRIKEDVIAVTLAGDYEKKEIPKKLEEELNVKVIAFPGSHEGYDKAYNYPIEVYEVIVSTLFGPLKIKILTTLPKTLGEILEDKELNNIVLIPGSTRCLSCVENPVEPCYEIAKRVIKNNKIDIVISHENPPGAMSAVATNGNRLIPVWYLIENVARKELYLTEDENKEIENLYQKLLEEGVIVIDNRIKDPISAMNNILKAFYGMDVDDSIIKACLVYLAKEGWKVKIGVANSPKEVVEFYNSISSKKRMILYGHIHEDSTLRGKHGYWDGNLLKVNVGPGFLGIFGILYPHNRKVEIYDSKQNKIIETYQFQ